MTPRRSLVVLASVLAAAAFARRADADDQAAAAAAVAQAVGQAVPGAQGAASGGAAAAKGPAVGSGGHFQRQLGTPQIMPKAHRGAGAKVAPDKKGSGKKGSGKAAKGDESKYKSRVLVENSEHSYRFDESGEPIDPAAKKAAASKKKAPAAPEEKDVKAGACSSDEPCNVKNPDADAL